VRMPAYEELSREQDDVCILAPLDKPIVVTGPPGTGKTVIAFYRAEIAAKAGHRPRVIMYNNVLHRFASDASAHPDVTATLSTWFKWFSGWWRATFNNAWVPQVKSFVYDWPRVMEQVAALPPEHRYRVPWGHVIVDEGQDFAPPFYELARFLYLGCQGRPDLPVMLSVFADENQRLFPDSSSTIREIKDALGVAPERCYVLTRNWRNTREIAAFAAHFFCGLPTGIPSLPEDRRGDRPSVRRTDAVNEAMDHIARYATLNDDIDIAVFTPTKALQTSVFNKLHHRLKDTKSVRVQQYTSDSKSPWNDPAQLSFGKGGTVTVLSKQSCKGLEFDAVFVPELQTYRCDPGAEDQFKMDFYVMCSRARNHLCLLYSANAGERPEILGRLPNHGDERAEWINA
jgi:DNA helicase II / ATP-dependent DNA helicase PcrA